MILIILFDNVVYNIICYFILPKCFIYLLIYFKVHFTYIQCKSL